MRIKFIQVEDYPLNHSIIGKEWQGNLEPAGDTIVAGHRIASNGVLKPFVEDITQYRIEKDEDGNEVKVEIIPEVEVAPKD